MFFKKNIKLFSTIILLTFVAASIAFSVFKERKQDPLIEVKNTPVNTKHQYIAYYLHGSARCQSCYKIEKYTTETINSKFVNEIKDGKLSMQIINVEERMNHHFIQDYSLNTKSVVLSEVNEGKEVKWKNLKKVWELLGNESKFSSYIESEVRTFLAEAKQ